MGLVNRDINDMKDQSRNNSIWESALVEINTFRPLGNIAPSTGCPEIYTGWLSQRSRTRAGPIRNVG